MGGEPLPSILEYHGAKAQPPRGTASPPAQSCRPEVVRVVGGWQRATKSSPHHPDTQKEEVLGRRSRTSLGGNSCSLAASGFHQQVWCHLHAVTGWRHAEPGEPGLWLEFGKARGQPPLLTQTSLSPCGAPALSSSCQMGGRAHKYLAVSGRRQGAHLMAYWVRQRRCRAWNTWPKPPPATGRQAPSKSSRVKTGRPPSRCSRPRAMGPALRTPAGLPPLGPLEAGTGRRAALPPSFRRRRSQPVCKGGETQTGALGPRQPGPGLGRGYVPLSTQRDPFQPAPFLRLRL